MGGNASGISGGDRVGESLNGTELLRRLEETQRLRSGQTPAEQTEALERLKREFSLSDAKFQIVKDGFARGEDPAVVLRSVLAERVDVTRTDRLQQPEVTNRTGVSLRGRVTPTVNPRLEAIKGKQSELAQKMTFGFEVSLGSAEMHRAELAGGYVSWSVMSVDQGRLRTALTDEIGTQAASRWDVGTDPGTLEVRPPVQKMETIFSSMEPLFKAAKKAKVIADFGFGGYWSGGGHIHVGRNIFDENPLLLRNLLVEVTNRPYIQAIFEALEDDQAKSIRQYGQMPQFKAVVDAVDQQWRATNGQMQIQAVLDALRPVSGGTRYRDVNLTNMYGGSPPTVEFRIHRGQSTAEECRDLSEFWTYVLANLSLEKSPIALATMSDAEAETLRMPSRAKPLMQKFLHDIGIPNPERFDRFFDQRFPDTAVKLGPAEKPDVEIRFADFVDQNDTPAYEVLVKNPSITQIQMGGRPVELFAAPELGEGVRIGRYVHQARGNATTISGVPGVTNVDFTEARRPVDEFRPVVPSDQDDEMAARAIRNIR